MKAAKHGINVLVQITGCFHNFSRYPDVNTSYHYAQEAVLVGDYANEQTLLRSDAFFYNALTRRVTQQS